MYSAIKLGHLILQEGDTASLTVEFYDLTLNAVEFLLVNEQRSRW